MHLVLDKKIIIKKKIIQNCSYNNSFIKRKENLNTSLTDFKNKFIFNYRLKHTNLSNKSNINRKKRS